MRFTTFHEKTCKHFILLLWYIFLIISYLVVSLTEEVYNHTPFNLTSVFFATSWDQQLRYVSIFLAVFDSNIKIEDFVAFPFIWLKNLWNWAPLKQIHHTVDSKLCKRYTNQQSYFHRQRNRVNNSNSIQPRFYSAYIYRISLPNLTEISLAN